MPSGNDTITPEDELLDPHLPIPAELSARMLLAAARTTKSTTPPQFHYFLRVLP